MAYFVMSFHETGCRELIYGPPSKRLTCQLNEVVMQHIDKCNYRINTLYSSMALFDAHAIVRYINVLVVNLILTLPYY